MAENWEVPFARLEGKVDSLTDDTQRIVKLLEGNGKPGMVQRLAEAEKGIEGVEKRQSESADDRKWLWRALGGALISAVIGAMVVYLVQTGRHTVDSRPGTEARP